MKRFKTFEDFIFERVSRYELKQIDKYADQTLGVDVVLTDEHFFRRLNDPRNRDEITDSELMSFIRKLAENKDKFLAFLTKYKEIVATDKRSSINIPFMKQADKVIAKTIMRKKNYRTSNRKFNL